MMKEWFDYLYKDKTRDEIMEQFYYENTELNKIEERVYKAIKFIKEIVIPYGDEWHWDDAHVRDYLEITLNILQNGSEDE